MRILKKINCLYFSTELSGKDMRKGIFFHTCSILEYGPMFILKKVTIIFYKKVKTLLWSTALKFYLLLKKLISTIGVALVFNMGNMVINMSKQPKYWKPITASEYYEGKFSLYATVLYWCSRWVCKVMIFRFRTLWSFLGCLFVW